MRSGKLLTLFVIVLLNWGCSQEKVDTEALARTVQEQAGKFATAVNNEDLEGFMSLFQDDAVITRPDETVFEGTDAIRQWAVDTFGPYDMQMEVESEKMLVYPAGKKAFDRGIYFIDRTPKDGGETEKESGWYRLFWHRQADGSWKITRLNWLRAQSTSEDPETL